MAFISTRGAEAVSAPEAIVRGIAPDGGLYVPEQLPLWRKEDFAALAKLDYPARAARVLSQLLDGFTQEELLPKIPGKIRDLFKEICAFIELIDEELDAVQLKYYKAYKKIQNVICIEAHKEKVILYLKLDPTKEKLVRGFSRDVSKIGHYGTGSLEISISDEAQFEEAKPIIERAIREA